MYNDQNLQSHDDLPQRKGNTYSKEIKFKHVQYKQIGTIHSERLRLWFSVWCLPSIIVNSSIEDNGTHLVAMLMEMLIGVCTDTYVFYQSVLEKKTDWSGILQRT